MVRSLLLRSFAFANGFDERHFPASPSHCPDSHIPIAIAIARCPADDAELDDVALVMDRLAVGLAAHGEIGRGTERRRYPQRQLADRLGVTAPWLNRRVHGQVSLNLDELAKIADALDMTVTELLGESA